MFGILVPVRISFVYKWVSHFSILIFISQLQIWIKGTLAPSYKILRKCQLFCTAGDDEVPVPGPGAEARRYVNRSLRRRNRRILDLNSALDETNYIPIRPSNAERHSRYSKCGERTKYKAFFPPSLFPAV